jgi:hypothetical protein
MRQIKYKFRFEGVKSTMRNKRICKQLFLYFVIGYLLYNVFTLNSSKTYSSIATPFECQLIANQFSQYKCLNLVPVYTLGVVDNRDVLPYVSGATFVLLSDFAFTNSYNNLQINRLKPGNIIYVHTDALDKFFSQIYPKISCKFILITHNSDSATNETYIQRLEEEKIIAWFGINMGFYHPKHFLIPLGFVNTAWALPKTKFIRDLRLESLIPWEKRKYLIYLNFTPRTHHQSRAHLFELFRNFTNVLIVNDYIDYEKYMENIGNSKYVLCPRGTGIDTHRFYETILMGAIPVVENSTLYPIFKETNAIIMDDFKSLKEEMLFKKVTKVGKFSRKVLFMKTWQRKIEKLRAKFIS